MDSMNLALHGLAIKKHAAPEEIAGLIGCDPADVAALLNRAAQSGRAQEAAGRFVLTPLARVALESGYSRDYADVRADDAFMAAYETFEVINVQLKAIITDWQTIELGGRRVANDHSDQDHDDRVIDRLGACHDRADPILRALEGGVPRLGYYRRKLLEALEKAEDGAVEWVSDARIESYHTLWFELHEDVLRIVGRARQE